MQIVGVGGRVKAPGRYPLEPGMHVSDLIRAGGSLEEAAYGGQAELTRHRVINGEYRQVDLVVVDLAALMRGDTIGRRRPRAVRLPERQGHAAVGPGRVDRDRRRGALPRHLSDRARRDTAFDHAAGRGAHRPGVPGGQHLPARGPAREGAGANRAAHGEAAERHRGRWRCRRARRIRALRRR